MTTGCRPIGGPTFGEELALFLGEIELGRYLVAALVLTALVALVSPALQGTLTTALVAVLLFLVFDPLRKRAQVALDRKFRQGAYDPAQLVTDVVGDLRDAGEDLASVVLHRKNWPMSWKSR